MQFLAMGLALFSSTVAVRDFAAVAMRTFSIKDFDSLIPGRRVYGPLRLPVHHGHSCLRHIFHFIEKPLVIMPLDRIINATQALTRRSSERFAFRGWSREHPKIKGERERHYKLNLATGRGAPRLELGRALQGTRHKLNHP